VGSGGRVSQGLAIGITDDFIAGRDPEAVYEQCAIRLSGQEPTEPYELPIDNGET